MFRKEKIWIQIARKPINSPSGELLDDFVKEIKLQFPSIKEEDQLRIDTEYWGHDGGKELEVTHWRLETDEEYEKAKNIHNEQSRKKAENQKKLKKEESRREKELYKKLHAKYGSKTRKK